MSSGPGRSWLCRAWVAALCIAACSGGDADDGGTAGSATAGSSSTAGSGGAGAGAGTGAGSGAGTGAGETITLELSADGMPLAAAELGVCPGQCVMLSAEAVGGVPPHTFVWSDNGLVGPGPHEVCPEGPTSLTLTVSDAPGVEEFERSPLMATRSVTLSPSGCETMPGDPCTVSAPAPMTTDTAELFDPVVEWRWTEGTSYVTPLVANLTDDNADGLIDTRDTPDVVIVAMLESGFEAAIVVLDGATGQEHFRIPGVFADNTPALGDLDGDGRVDIAATLLDPTTSKLSLAAFRHDGTPLWDSPPAIDDTAWPAALAIADLDNDGSPEIMNSTAVFSADGARLWTADEVVAFYLYNSPTAVDLDGNGDLEVVFGPFAYQHDGTLIYSNVEIIADTCVPDASYCSNFVAVADLDGDDDPEIVVSTRQWLFVLDHYGVTLHKTQLIEGIPGPAQARLAFPPAVHDVDGDGTPEIMLSNGNQFLMFDGTLMPRWSMPVTDSSGIAAGTAFDFLGDGSAEAMYADETTFWVFDGLDGHVLMSQSRYSGTVIEYPTVVDVDNDGSAELLVVSMDGGGPPEARGLQVIGDRNDRWVPARRIYNQDTYHVTNVNEDGSIPQHEAPHWRLNNSFRAQAQINPDGQVCLPVLE